jgi:plastocyanin
MYRIPTDNPFQGQVLYSPQASPQAQNGGYTPAARPEIWAYGLRNPWQFNFDRETGDMYIADVGQNAWEEINVLSPDSEGAANFGWPILEGAHCYLTIGDECNSFGELPVAEYNHGDGSCSITGIGVYRGTESTALNGIYFTSDFCSGKVWGLAQGDDDQWNLAELLDTDLLVTGSGEDEAGELYLTACTCQYGRNYNALENPGGSVWRIVASDQVPEGAETTESAGGTGTEGADTGGAEAGASTALTATGDITSTEGLTGTEIATDTSTSATNGTGSSATGTITETSEITGTDATTGTGETAGTGATGGTEATAGEERVIEVIARSMDFVPGTEEPIQIKVGETIRFVVTTPDIYHTFTVATDESKETVLFNLDVFPGTEPSEIVYTFDEAGSFYLYCIPHENLGMVGSIEVTE